MESSQGSGGAALCRLTESMEIYADCLRLMELALGHRHINVAAVLNNLAGLSVRLHMHTSAEGLYARALTIIRSHYGAQHPRCARPPPSPAAAFHTARLCRDHTEAAYGESTQRAPGVHAPQAEEAEVASPYTDRRVGARGRRLQN